MTHNYTLGPEQLGLIRRILGIRDTAAGELPWQSAFATFYQRGVASETQIGLLDYSYAQGPVILERSIPEPHGADKGFLVPDYIGEVCDSFARPSTGDAILKRLHGAREAGFVTVNPKIAFDVVDPNPETLRPNTVSVSCVYQSTASTAPALGADFVSTVLNHLIAVGVRFPRMPSVTGYLRQHLELARHILRFSGALLGTFGSEAQISLELYRDPEISAEYLTFYVRRDSYPGDFLDKLDELAEQLTASLDANTPWIHVTTDFKQPI